MFYNERWPENIEMYREILNIYYGCDNDDSDDETNL